MKGIMFTAQGVAEFTDEPEPECGDQDVLLKTLYSGLSNGTERSFLVGGPYGGNKWPNRIAYLTVSEVLEAGNSVSKFQPGDLVYTGTYPGHVPLHTAKERDLIVKLPAGLDPKSATMLGLAGVSYFNTNRIGVGENDNVLVTGSGPIGLMALQSAKSMGARVTLSSKTAHRREVGIQMGADAAFDPESDWDALKGRGPYSAWLECAGADIDTYIKPPDRLLDRFSRVALIAGRIRVEYHFLWASSQRITFYQSTHFDQPTLERVAQFAADGTLNLGALIRDVVSIQDAIGVYDTLRDDPMSLGGTVFDWT
jgi:2-desacetyl-2-hydroxyethyl bacteriochlorophyllide A dehydrogenase